MDFKEKCNGPTQIQQTKVNAICIFCKAVSNFFFMSKNNIVLQEVTLVTWKCLCSATESDSTNMEKSEIEMLKKEVS